MAYPQYFGQTNKVHNTGVLIYGGDGTNAFPVAVDSNGYLQIELLAGTAEVGSLGASTARIGTVSGVGKTVSVTKALISSVAYSAEDVLSEASTNGTGTAWTFSAIFRANNTGGYITKAMAICETTDVTPKLRLLLFNATPTCELDDNAGSNALLHGDVANFVGQIDFPAMSNVGGDSIAIASPSTYGNLPLWVDSAAAADDLFGVLVTLDAFTNTATNDMTIVLSLEQY